MEHRRIRQEFRHSALNAGFFDASLTPWVTFASTNWETHLLRLDHFLKLNGIAATGGHAKLLIQNGEVSVDGQVEIRRRRKLANGNVVRVGGSSFIVSGLSLEEDHVEPS